MCLCERMCEFFLDERMCEFVCVGLTERRERICVCDREKLCVHKRKRMGVCRACIRVSERGGEREFLPRLNY